MRGLSATEGVRPPAVTEAGPEDPLPDPAATPSFPRPAALPATEFPPSAHAPSVRPYGDRPSTPSSGQPQRGRQPVMSPPGPPASDRALLAQGGYPANPRIRLQLKQALTAAARRLEAAPETAFAAGFFKRAAETCHSPEDVCRLLERAIVFHPVVRAEFEPLVSDGAMRKQGLAYLAPLLSLWPLAARLLLLTLGGAGIYALGRRAGSQSNDDRAALAQTQMEAMRRLDQFKAHSRRIDDLLQQATEMKKQLQQTEAALGEAPGAPGGWHSRGLAGAHGVGPSQRQAPLTSFAQSQGLSTPRLGVEPGPLRTGELPAALDGRFSSLGRASDLAKLGVDTAAAAATGGAARRWLLPGFLSRTWAWTWPLMIMTGGVTLLDRLLTRGERRRQEAMQTRSRQLVTAATTNDERQFMDVASRLSPLEAATLRQLWDHHDLRPFLTNQQNASTVLHSLAQFAPVAGDSDRLYRLVVNQLSPGLASAISPPAEMTTWPLGSSPFAAGAGNPLAGLKKAAMAGPQPPPAPAGGATEFFHRLLRGLRGAHPWRRAGLLLGGAGLLLLLGRYGQTLFGLPNTVTPLANSRRVPYRFEGVPHAVYLPPLPNEKGTTKSPPKPPSPASTTPPPPPLWPMPP